MGCGSNVTLDKLVMDSTVSCITHYQQLSPDADVHSVSCSSYCCCCMAAMVVYPMSVTMLMAISSGINCIFETLGSFLTDYLTLYVSHHL